jgi:hypothetical protein
VLHSLAAAIEEPSAETLAARAALAQLLLSVKHTLLSPRVASLMGRLAPVEALYDQMHDLPVVQKRSNCREMLEHRDEVMQVRGHWGVGGKEGMQGWVEHGMGTEDVRGMCPATRACKACCALPSQHLRCARHLVLGTSSYHCLPLCAQDPSFCEALAMLVALRGQVWSTSQALATGVDSVPIDLLLGSLSPELAQQLKDLLPQVGCWGR